MAPEKDFVLSRSSILLCWFVLVWNTCRPACFVYRVLFWGVHVDLLTSLPSVKHLHAQIYLQTFFDSQILSVLTAPPFWVTILMNSDAKGNRSVRRPTSRCLCSDTFILCMMKTVKFLRFVSHSLKRWRLFVCLCRRLSDVRAWASITALPGSVSLAGRAFYPRMQCRRPLQPRAVSCCYRLLLVCQSGQRQALTRHLCKVIS